MDNSLFLEVYWSVEHSEHRQKLERAVASELGMKHSPGIALSIYFKTDFWKCVQAAEAFHRQAAGISQYLGSKASDIIQKVLAMSETDLGLTWKNGEFRPKGAELLDDGLVNDPLKWLRQADLPEVVAPFEKALRHLMEGGKRPELYQDAVTDAYEAVESIAKTVTGRARDLSGNSELFLSKLGVSEPYKKLLKEYIGYANIFRHSPDDHRPRPKISYHESESFVYLTGALLRIATETGLPSRA